MAGNESSLQSKVIEVTDYGVSLGDLKEIQVLEGVANGMTPQEACSAAGFKMTQQNAKNFLTYVKMKHAEVNHALLEALGKKGVDFDKLAGVIKDGLEAETHQVVGTGQYEKVADHRTRHKFLETTLELVPGAKPAKQVEITHMTFEQRLQQLAEMEG